MKNTPTYSWKDAITAHSAPQGFGVDPGQELADFLMYTGLSSLQPEGIQDIPRKNHHVAATSRAYWTPLLKAQAMTARQNRLETHVLQIGSSHVIPVAASLSIMFLTLQPLTLIAAAMDLPPTQPSQPTTHYNEAVTAPPADKQVEKALLPPENPQPKPEDTACVPWIMTPTGLVYTCDQPLNSLAETRQQTQPVQNISLTEKDTVQNPPLDLSPVMFTSPPSSKAPVKSKSTNKISALQPILIEASLPLASSPTVPPADLLPVATAPTKSIPEVATRPETPPPSPVAELRDIVPQRQEEPQLPIAVAPPPVKTETTESPQPISETKPTEMATASSDKVAGDCAPWIKTPDGYVYNCDTPGNVATTEPKQEPAATQTAVSPVPETVPIEAASSPQKTTPVQAAISKPPVAPVQPDALTELIGSLNSDLASNVQTYGTPNPEVSMAPPTETLHPVPERVAQPTSTRYATKPQQVGLLPMSDSDIGKYTMKTATPHIGKATPKIDPASRLTSKPVLMKEKPPVKAAAAVAPQTKPIHQAIVKTAKTPEPVRKPKTLITNTRQKDHTTTITFSVPPSKVQPVKPAHITVPIVAEDERLPVVHKHHTAKPAAHATLMVTHQPAVPQRRNMHEEQLTQSLLPEFNTANGYAISLSDLIAEQPTIELNTAPLDFATGPEPITIQKIAEQPSDKGTSINPISATSNPQSETGHVQETASTETRLEVPTLHHRPYVSPEGWPTNPVSFVTREFVSLLRILFFIQ